MTQETFEKLKDFLQEGGISYFRSIKCKYGRYDAVYKDGCLPHSVHSNDGMIIRNFLTSRCDYKWEDVENTWMDVLQEFFDILDKNN